MKNIASTAVSAMLIGTAAAMNTQDFAQFGKGFIEGIEGHQIENITQCFQDSKEVAADLEQAVKDFEHMSLSSVTAGFGELSSVVQEVYHTVHDCKAVSSHFDAVAEIAAEFAHPSALAVKTGKALFFHGMDIFRDVEDSVSQYHSGNFEQMGKDLGEASSLVLLGREYEHQNVELLKYFEIIDGIVLGVFDHEGVSSLETCIRDANPIAALLDKGIHDYINGNPSKGTVAIGRAVNQLKSQMIPDCKSLSDEDMQELSDMGDVFTHPLHFIGDLAEHIVVNGIVIDEDILKATHAWDEEKFVECGEHLGHSLALVFWGRQPAALYQNASYLKYVELLEGIVRGVLDREDIDSLEQCVEDINPIAETLYAAFEDYKAGKTAKASLLAGQALHQFQKTMKPDCQNITAEDQQTLQNMAEIFKHPIGLLVHTVEHIFFDNIAIEGELIHAVHAYDEEKYVAAGEFIGEAMSIVFWGKHAATAENLDTGKILKIVDGVFMGILGHEDLQSVDQCVEDAFPIANTLVKAFKDYKAGKTAKASILAGQALHQFTSTMKPDCMNITDEDVATLENMFDAFKHPLTEVIHIGEHIIVDGIAIEKDLVHMVHAYDEGNYEKCGEFLGDAISTVFWGKFEMMLDDFSGEASDGNKGWEITQVVDGFIIGVFKKEGVDSVEECLEDASSLAVFMEKAIADFKDPTVYNIGDGIYQLGLFIQEVAISMDNCASFTPEDIAIMKEMGDAFTHPLHEIIAIGEHIVVDGIFVQYEILAAVHLWDVGKYQAAGERLGEGLALILWGKKLNDIQEFSNGIEDGVTAQVLEIIDGIIYGVFKTEGVSTVTGCIEDINSIAVFIDEAVHQFKLGGYHNIVQGVYYIGEAVSQLGLSVEDCSSLTADQVETLKHMGEVFKHPGSLSVDIGKHIAVNGVEIYSDVKNAIKEWDAELWFKFGTTVGDAFALVMWGEPHFELLQ